MNPSFFVCVAASVAALSAFGAHAADIDWLPNWAAQDKAVYEVKRCRQSNGPKPVDLCGTSQLEILVLQSDIKGSVQRWRSGGLVEGLAASGLSPEMAALLKKASQTPMDIEFDESAQPVRLRNAKEVRAMFDAVIQGLTSAPEIKGADPRLPAMVKDTVARLVDTDEKLLALSSKDASILYSPLGGRFPDGETKRLRSAMPSPFGTAPIGSMVSITAQLPDPAGREMQLAIDEDIDPAAIGGLVDEMIKPMLQNLGRPEAIAEVRKALLGMTMSRSTRYRINLDSAWPMNVTWKQSIETGDRHRIDQIEFRRIR
jgi:hypothetical protein